MGCAGYWAPGRPWAGCAAGFGVGALAGGRVLPDCADGAGRRPFGAQLVTGAGRWLADG